MIIDKTDHLPYYKSLLPNLEAGLKAIEKLGSNPGTGRYEFKGGFFMIQEGETRLAEEGDYEAHKRYLDVQILLSGSEMIVWADKEELEISEEYDPQKDKEMRSGAMRHLLSVSEGMCWIAFPWDAHKACRDMGARCHYKKAVLKLPVSGAECRTLSPGGL